MGRLRRADVLIGDERGTGDGWWAYYPVGWKSSSDPMGCVHADHEDTKRELLSMVAAAIPCDCEDCCGPNLTAAATPAGATT